MKRAGVALDRASAAELARGLGACLAKRRTRVHLASAAGETAPLCGRYPGEVGPWRMTGDVERVTCPSCVRAWGEARFIELGAK